MLLAVSSESWEGLPGSFCSSSQAVQDAAAQEASAAARIAPSSMCGLWKVFEVNAAVVEDVSLEAGLPAPVPGKEAIHKSCRGTLP